MKPTIKLATKTDAFQYLWLKNVSGFDPRYHCYDCLKGNRSALIPLKGGKKYPAKFSVEGRIEEPAPYAYLCAVFPAARGIASNVHLLMEPDENSTIAYEDDNILPPFRNRLFIVEDLLQGWLCCEYPLLDLGGTGWNGRPSRRGNAS